MEFIQFGNLKCIHFLWVVPFLAALFAYFFAKRERDLAKFAESETLRLATATVSKRKQKLKASLLVLVMLFALLALLQPRWGFHLEEVKRTGVDIVVALDTSESMLAEDVRPDRLERAKREIKDLIGMMAGDRIGLVAFAGTSFVECPLTMDYGAAMMFLDFIDTSIIPQKGTNLASAIRTAVEAFSASPRKSRALILITDGEDHSGQALKAAQQAAQENIKIYPVGIGRQGGAPIPLQDGTGGFKKDRRGNLIMTKLDEELLMKIAAETGGKYVRSVTGDLDLEEIYLEQIGGALEKRELKSEQQKRWEERFQWPLLVAIVLLSAEVFISERKS